MKKYYFCILLIVCSIPCHATKLMCSMNFNPYVGVDYQYLYVATDQNWGRVLPKNYNNFALFVGNKYHEHFGIELGFYHTIGAITKNANMTSFNGLNASGPTSAVSKVKNKGFSAEWNVYFGLKPNLEIFSILGFVTLHSELTISSNSGTDLANALVRVRGRNKTFLRLGLGSKYAFKNWGMRAKLVWDDKQNLYLNTNNAQNIFATIDRKAYKQGVGLILGMYYIF